MKYIIAFLAASLSLGACSNSQSLKQGAMSLPVFMSEEVTIERQRPRMPNTIALSWDGADRFYDAITIDYVSGMSQRAYLFEEPTKSVYRPMLAWALNEADLLADTNLAARYALQVEFSELDSDFFGADLAGKSTATYRLVDRQTGQPVYEKQISSNFVALYPRLNEDDAARAYDISEPPFVRAQNAFAGYAIGEGVIVETINNSEALRDFFGGRISEASQAAWNDAYQAYFWASGVSLLAGPTTVAAQQLNPMNYLNLKFNNQTFASHQAQARFGALSKAGLGSRNGAERARQVSAQILAQSITLFLLDLSKQEQVEFTHILPCNGGAAVNSEWQSLMLAGHKVVSDNCRSYAADDVPGGLGVASWR